MLCSTIIATTRQEPIVARKPRSAPVITRTGDTGTTGLLGERRVAKDHPQVEAFGAVDEATSAIGLARAAIADRTVRELLLQVQRDLYELMADLALTPENWGRAAWHITGEKIAALEEGAEQLRARTTIPPKFVIPGETFPSAALDLARTIVRRAERRAVTLQRLGVLGNPLVLTYLNRASDVLFIAARYVEQTNAPSAPESGPGAQQPPTAGP